MQTDRTRTTIEKATYAQAKKNATEEPPWNGQWKNYW